ncbi:hypothetical protein BRADI_5g00385v3, partial [Brachypodium distachyon]
LITNRVTGSVQGNVLYKLCCRGRRIRLPLYKVWPSPLRELASFSGDRRSRHFMRLIRSYNSLFVFTSLGVDIDKSINTGNGPYVFRACGKAHHRIGSLVPVDGKSPQFAQLYVYDVVNELANHLGVFGCDDESVVLLILHNLLVRTFRMASQRLHSPTCPNLAVRILGSDSSDPNVYSPPTAPELAALVVGDFTADRCKFDIVVEGNDGPLRRVSELHPALMALQYPLLFPYGEKGVDRWRWFVSYMRRDTSHFVQKGVHALDNRWVIPYNLSLLKKYQAQINVEWCNKTHLVKYLFKYVLKGNDRARVRIHDPTVRLDDSVVTDGETFEAGVDEVEEYVNCRYLSSCEAMWRMFSFDVHVRNPSIERLEIHLPGMNRVTYSENDSLSDVVQWEDVRKSTLTEWFAMNRMFTWYSEHKRWTPRGCGTRIGRIRYVHPTKGELFYLRMLLMSVRGARSFEDLQTYRGQLHPTFREACQARGLLGDDKEWFRVFDETVLWATPRQLRDLFVTILMFCDVADAGSLFADYWEFMSEDIKYTLRQALRNQSYVIPKPLLRVHLFRKLSALFTDNCGSICHYNLPSAVTPARGASANRLVLEETCYDACALASEWEVYSKLNSGQLAVYRDIMDAVEQRKAGAFFVSGYGVLAVASSGVAALLLPGGRTTHSRFHIPVDIDEKQTALILWDEAPMSHRRCFECLDRSLKDILSENQSDNSKLIFGGLPVVLGGDFRQVLPILPGASKREVLDAALCRSVLWRDVKVFNLSDNMRLQRTGLSCVERDELSWFPGCVLSMGD